MVQQPSNKVLQNGKQKKKKKKQRGGNYWRIKFLKAQETKIFQLQEPTCTEQGEWQIESHLDTSLWNSECQREEKIFKAV